MADTGLLTVLAITFPLKILAEESTLENETPLFVVQLLNKVIEFLIHYGWYLVLTMVLSIYILFKIWPQVTHLRLKWEEDAYNKKLDSEAVRARQEAMDARYRKLQEDLDKKAQLYKEEQKVKEEQKRLEKIEDWENHQQGKGYKNKYKPKDNTPDVSSTVLKKKASKSDNHNPLMGFGSGSNYRPSRNCNTGS